MKISYNLILLDRDFQRKKHINENVLPKHNFEIFNAIDWKSKKFEELFLQEKEIFVNTYLTSSPLKGQLATTFSHLLLWKELENKNYDHYIIAEDDVIIKDDFEKQINNIINEINEDYDIVFLFICDRNRKKTRFISNKQFVKKSRIRWGLICYLLSKRGIKNLIKFAENISDPIDVHVAKLARRDIISGYCAVEKFVETMGQLTNIEDGPFQSNIWTSDKYVNVNG